MVGVNGEGLGGGGARREMVAAGLSTSLAQQVWQQHNCHGNTTLTQTALYSYVRAAINFCDFFFKGDFGFRLKCLFVFLGREDKTDQGKHWCW